MLSILPLVLTYPNESDTALLTGSTHATLSLLMLPHFYTLPWYHTLPPTQGYHACVVRRGGGKGSLSDETTKNKFEAFVQVGYRIHNFCTMSKTPGSRSVDCGCNILFTSNRAFVTKVVLQHLFSLMGRIHLP